MAKIVGIKFKRTAKSYYFDPKGQEYKRGAIMIVETARGVEYGKVVVETKEVPDSEVVQPLKPVIRLATSEDIKKIKKDEERAVAAIKTANEKVAARGVKMKIIDAEYTFDNGKLVFYFTAANRVDFRDLVKDLASAFHSRIELRQVGTRDETRLLGGIAPCGREVCCASCLPDFRKVTIKMAKTQGLSLNPAKISGLCGRLMCCLEYENEYYSETYKKMPKIGSEVDTPDGKAIVVSNNMITLKITTKKPTGDGGFTYKEYALAEIKVKKANKLEDIKDDDSKEMCDLEN
ncbi:MAG: stage 0 sporulation family protein [Candidatus Borkfalkiaceae bacterium]|nr:stage 0 sporulation family protein [Christensenellaceae bacterium]MDY3725223.1 stage 0 sporulation family protein [Christensenellaceae bacterium]